MAAKEETTPNFTQTQAAQELGYKSRHSYLYRKNRLNKAIKERLTAFTTPNNDLNNALTGLISEAQDLTNEIRELKEEFKAGRTPMGLDPTRHDLLDVIKTLSTHITTLLGSLNRVQVYIDQRREAGISERELRVIDSGGLGGLGLEERVKRYTMLLDGEGVGE